MSLIFALCRKSCFLTCGFLFPVPTMNIITGLRWFLLWQSKGKVACAVFNFAHLHTCILAWRSSSTEGCLPPMVIFHQRSSSTRGCLPPKVVFHQRCLPLKVVFQQRLSFTEGSLPPMVVLHWSLSSSEVLKSFKKFLKDFKRFDFFKKVFKSFYKFLKV